MTDGAPMHMRKTLIAGRPIPTLIWNDVVSQDFPLILNAEFGGHEELKQEFTRYFNMPCQISYPPIKPTV